MVPVICRAGDDEQHDGSVLCDVAALQALSRRVHFGRFVAESKYRERRESYSRLCGAGDARGVNDLLTDVEAENRVIERVYDKAAAYARKVSEDGAEARWCAVSTIFRDFVIPLTKEVEIMYLFERTGYPCPPLRRLLDAGVIRR